MELIVFVIFVAVCAAFAVWMFWPVIVLALVFCMLFSAVTGISILGALL